MAQKKEGKGLKEQILGAFSSNLVPMLKDGINGLIKKAQDAIYHTQQKVVENLLMASVFILGFILLTVGVVYFINDYFMLERYWGFMIIGLLLMIIAWIFRKHIEKTKYCRMD